MANGDAYRAGAILKMLNKLADGPDPTLREMASGILQGDLKLRDAAANSAYSDAIADRFAGFWQRYQELTPEEHQALITEGHQFIENSAPSQTSDSAS